MTEQLADRMPKRVICELADQNGCFICEFDKDGLGCCGDAIMDREYLCSWIKEVLEWWGNDRKVS